MRKTAYKAAFVLTTITLVVVLTYLFSASSTQAAEGINRTINFQGKLVGSDGINVADGDYSIEFAIYDVDSGGSALWSETQSTVSVTGGVFQVALGSSTAIPSNLNFNWDGLYLGVNVESDGEMTPRIRLTAVPYAFNSEKVAGLTVEDESGNASTSATLQIANDKTLRFLNSLTFQGTDSTIFTLPGATGTLVTLDSTGTLTNKTIGSTGLTFSGATTDITTATDESFTLTPNGEGDIILSNDGDSDLVFSGFTSNGGILFTDDSGVVAQVNAGTTSQCLLGGTNPSFGSCATGVDESKWVLSSEGMIYPINETVDFLVGGTSTMSAKFAVLNVNDGTPVASVSAGSVGTYLTGDGVLGTTALAQLSIGGPTTGDIVIDSQTGVITFEDGININGPIAFEGSITVEDTQFIGLGETAGRIVFTNTITDELDIENANIDLNNNLITNIGHANTDFTSGGGLNLAGALTVTGTGTFNGLLDANGTVTLGDGGDTIAINSNDWGITAAGVGTGFDSWAVDNITLNAAEISLSSVTPNIEIGDGGTLIFDDGTNTLFSIVDRGTTGAIVVPDAGVLSIGGSGSSVAYNVFGDSTAGAYVTDLDSDDDVYIEGNIEVDGTVRFNNQTLTFPSGAGSSGYLLSTNGSGTLSWIEVAGSIERWAETDNALHPLYDSWDFVIGGNSTASAKFAFINVSSGTPTASIAGNLTFDSAGVIQTTEMQTLTIGGSETGDIAFAPGNGSGLVDITGDLDLSGDLDVLGDLNVSTTSHFGDVSNYAEFSSGGDLTFAGTGDYLVGPDRYAFRYSAAENFGLLFNATDSRFEFTDGTATRMFSVGATTGNGYFAGTLDVIGVTTTDGLTSTSDIDAGTNSIIASSWDGEGAVALTAGSGDITSFTFTTDGTGDSEIQLPTGSIGNGEILDNTIGFSDLANALALDATTTITPGTSNFVFNLDNTGDYLIQDSGTSFAQFLDDGTITLGKAAAASTINIGVGTGIDTINIGTGTVGADVITIGNNTGTIALDGINFDLSSAGVITMSEELILSAVSGEGISGGGLSDCDAATDKLQWDSTTNQFSCGTDTNIASVYDVYDNAGSQSVGTTPIVVNLDTPRRTHSNYSLSSDEITVNSDGVYSITFTGGAEYSSTQRGSSRVYLEVNTGSGFSEEDGSSCYAYWRQTTNGSSCSKTVVLELEDGDEIRLGIVGSSNGGITQADTASITIAKWEDTTGGGGGGGGINGVGVRESDGSPTVTEATTIEFGPDTSSTDEFIVTDEGSNVARVRLGDDVAMLSVAELVTGGWTFSTGATTFSSVLYGDGGIDTTSDNDLSLASDGTGDILFDIDADSNIQISASGAPAVDMFSISNTGQGITTDAVNGIQLDFVTNAVAGARTNAAMSIDVTSGATEGSDTLYGINIGNLTSASSGTEIALNIGTSWDTAIFTNSGDINAGTGTLTAATWDASGATALGIGSGDVTQLVVTTDSTGDSEVQLPTGSIGAAEILDDALTTSDLNATLTFSDGDFIDLASIIHDDSALQGLRLPQASSLTSPGSGEGFLAYNTSSDVVQVFNGSDWVSIAGAAIFDDIYDESVSEADLVMEIDDSGGLAFNLTTTGNFVLQDDGTSFAQFINDGTITLGKAAAAGVLNLGIGTAADTINIGTDSTTGDSITIGNSNSSTTLNLYGGDYDDWYIDATGAAKFNTIAGAGLYDDCDLPSNKLIWDASTQVFSCSTDNDSGGNPNLQNILGATADGVVRDSDNYTVNWNWDFTSAGVDAGLNITESSASINGTQDQQALLRIETLSGSTASPFQLTSAGSDVADIYFDLTGSGDIEFRDSGSPFATFADDTTIELGANSSTFSVDATNIDISTAGTLTLYGTTDITTDTNANLVFLPNGTGDVIFETDGNSTFAVEGLQNCDTIDTDSNGVFSCGTDSSGGGTGTLDDAYNNGGTIIVDAYDILFNLNDASNDYGFVIDASVNGTIDNALEITTTGGGAAAFTTAIDLSDDGIVNALDIGSNIINGNSYTIQASTALTLGGGSETLEINSSDWDISTDGNLSGIGTINTDGNLTITKSLPGIVLDSTTASDTDFWLATNNDGEGDDDDYFQIGSGTTPGTSPFLTLDSSGNLGLGVTEPLAMLDVNGTASISGGLTFYAGDGVIAATENNNLQIGNSETGNVLFYSSANSLDASGNLTLAGGLTLDGDVSNASGNLVLADTVDIGSASNGIQIDTEGNIVDNDGNIVLNDEVDLGSADNGINITTEGLISDSNGNIVLNDTVDIGSASNGIRVDTEGNIVDINGNIVLNDDTTIAGDISFSASTPTITISGSEVLAVTDGTDTLTFDTNNNYLRISDGTNGLTFDIDSGPSYSGTARPIKTISLSPEYAGAILTDFYGAGTDTNITGAMTSDSDTTQGTSIRNYYEWTSSQTVDQHFYTVAIRVTLPPDFDAWATTDALVVNYITENAAASQSDVDVRVYNENSSTIVASDLNNASATWATASIDDSTLDDGASSEWDEAGETAVIYLRMGSQDDDYARIGDIQLNYLASY